MSRSKPTSSAQQAKLPPATQILDDSALLVDIRGDPVDSYDEGPSDTRPSSPGPYSSLKKPNWGSVVDDVVVDISSRGSSRSRAAPLKEKSDLPAGQEEEDLGSSAKGRRKPIKKRTASVPTMAFEEMQRGVGQTAVDTDGRGFIDLNKIPFDVQGSDAIHQPAYDSDAALSITTSRRKGKEVMRNNEFVAGGDQEMDVAQAIPALRSLKNKSSGQLR